MEVEKKLMNIQHELKAPKAQFNSFGKYNYRSLEDILEAVKPLLYKEQCILSLSDQVIQIGDRFYIQAIAKITDTVSGESYSNTACAREETEKKGADGSQITGASSSYARKYCLSGLLLLDDTKDADTNEARTEAEAKTKKAEQKPEQKPAAKQAQKAAAKLPADKVNALVTKCEKEGVSIENICKIYKVKSLYQMTEKQWMNCFECWEQVKEANERMNANGRQSANH